MNVENGALLVDRAAGAAAAAIEVVPVATRDDEESFWRLPYALYRGDPCWVPPLRLSEKRRFRRRHNESLGARWCQRFLARREGRLLGRVAAIHDPAFADRWCPGTGLFGFYECAEPEAAPALLHAVESALGARGLRRCLGPVNLTTSDEVGLLVDGFRSPPMILSPYNPPRYEQDLLAAGYRPCREYHSYLWTPATRPSPAVERAVRSGRRERQGITIRPVDPADWEGEARRLHAAYSAAFAGLWGFVPLSWPEFEQRAASFRPILRPELALLAEWRGEVVGFALALPDVNAALEGSSGRLLPLGWFRLAWRLRRLRSARLLIAGVRPGFTGRGLAAALAYQMAVAARRLGLVKAELSLVQSGNHAMRHLIEAFGCRRVKTFRLFARDIGPAWSSREARA